MIDPDSGPKLFNFLEGLADTNYSPIVKAGTRIKGISGPKVYGRVRTDISDAYKVKVFDPNTGDLVVAYLNEDFTEQVSASWSNLINIDTSSLDSALQIFANKSTKAMIMYRQVWGGNSPFSGKLRLVFSAEEDAKQEVYLPIRILEKMASPSIQHWKGAAGEANERIFKFLQPPVPSARDPHMGIVIGIGLMFEYIGCVLTSVAPQYSRVLNPKGFPLYAECTVDFQLINPATKEDFGDL